MKGLNQSYFSAFIRIEKDDIEGLMDLEDIAELENQVMQGNIEACQNQFLTLHRKLRRTRNIINSFWMWQNEWRRTKTDC